MSPFEAIVYGVIQGLSEFLPVSSSGHLALLPHIMKIQDPGVVFDLMMHFGTALAVMAYFRKDLFLYAGSVNLKLVDFNHGSSPTWFTRNFIFSTMVSVFCIVLLMPISKMARDPYIIVFNLSFFGLILWLVDRSHWKKESFLESPMEQGMQWKMAALIGMAQALAIFPGVSRSGITLSAALLLGMKRKDAGSFSFLMSLPIILAGILKEIPHLTQASGEDLSVLLIGIFSSFVVGILTIHFFMRLITKIKLFYFALYRWVVAAAILYLIS
jgi:undecaprenyl-diphosphatase